MHARSKTTGKDIDRVYCYTPGAFGIEPGSFGKNTDGSLAWECDAHGTEHFYDDQHQARKNSEYLYLDTEGEIIPEDDIELYEDEDEDDAP